MQYSPLNDSERNQMLEAIHQTYESLFECLGENRFDRSLNLPDGLSELEVETEFNRLANKNTQSVCFLGGGAYNHYIPAVVSELASRSEFYTAYTPYQPEMSQGMLQAIFEYQSLICMLTGMDVSNASVYDGATAACEAMFMSRDIKRKNKIMVSGLHKEVLSVLKTYAETVGIEIDAAPIKDGVTDVEALEDRLNGDYAGIIVGHPNRYGLLEDMDAIGKIANGKGVLFVADIDPISLGILKRPSDYGADIVVGEGQSLGNPLSFGGPYLGFMAAKRQYMRNLPGRIVGQSHDKDGNTGYLLTLQAREQHIRRQRAMSNICSNQALNALTASIYLCTLGAKGLADIAELCTKKAHYACDKIINEVKFLEPAFDAPFFKEFTLKTDVPFLREKLDEYGTAGALPAGGDLVSFAVTECNSKKQIDKLTETLKRIGEDYYA